MYRCGGCGTRFNEPLVLTGREDLDGERGRETRREVLCPACGCPYFEEDDEDAS